MSTAVSLGYNCRTSSTLVSEGWRPSKADGYKTCPFDLCIAPYDGVVKCIQDKFCDFLNPSYLVMQTVPGALLESAHDEELLYNTKYGFVFLHESPGHGNLYETENWPGGKYHFVADNWAEFLLRYVRRINNFNAYIESGTQFGLRLGLPPPMFLLSKPHCEQPTLLFSTRCLRFRLIRYIIKRYLSIQCMIHPDIYCNELITGNMQETLCLAK